jgi:hypothetical protein
MTDLKALADSCSMEARKLPAAPALSRIISTRIEMTLQLVVGVHDKINTSKLLDTALDCLLQVVELAHVHRANADNLGTRPGSRNVLSDTLGLLYIATDDAGVGAEMD